MNRADRRRLKKNANKPVSHSKSAITTDPTSEQLEALIQEALETAVEHHKAGRLPEAEKLYQIVLQTNPNQPVALNLLGLIAFETERSDIALDLLNKSLAISPDYLDAIVNRGIVLQSLDRDDEAIQAFRRSVSLSPKSCDVLYNLGTLLRKTERQIEALEVFLKILSIQPDFDEVYNNLGLTYQDLDDIENAEKYFRKAIAVPHGNAEAHYNLARMHNKHGSEKEAFKHYHNAVSLNPNFTEALNNLGNVYKERGQWKETIDCYKKILSLDSEHIEAIHNLGLMQLLFGDFKNGWENYAHRWKMPQYLEHPRNQKGFFLKDSLFIPADTSLKNLNLSDKKAFVWMEQGIGDEIMFSSIFAKFAQNIQSLTVECDERLLPIFKRSLPNITFISKNLNTDFKSIIEEYDIILPAGELCEHYRPTLESFSKPLSYLKANEDKSKELRNYYKEKWPGKKLIGISWRSGNLTNRSKRSIPLLQWQRLLNNTDCTFINLQYGDTSAETENFEKSTGINVNKDDTINTFGDLDGFATQVSALDLVISIDNSTIMMSGALGIPTLVMLPMSADWRWLLERNDTIWFQSLQLFRQKKLETWDDVFNDVIEQLGKFISTN